MYYIENVCNIYVSNMNKKRNMLITRTNLWHKASLSVQYRACSDLPPYQHYTAGYKNRATEVLGYLFYPLNFSFSEENLEINKVELQILKKTITIKLYNYMQLTKISHLVYYFFLNTGMLAFYCQANTYMFLKDISF